MIVLLATAVVGGLVLALVASRVAIGRVSRLAAGSRIPPFIIGITLVAIGTDLPEIANSIVASLAGHGDLNVGDSVGSAATQSTLVLGLLPLIVGAFVVGRRRLLRIGGFTIGALLMGALLMVDGHLGRVDAVVLVVGWIVGSFFVFTDLPATEPAMRVRYARPGRDIAVALLALAAVGAGAGIAVWAFVEIASELAIPEYLLAFFGASIGTSLPELVVDVTALRRGEHDVAVGDVLGSSFVDSTLSVGIGPLIAPTAVTADLAVTGSVVAAGALVLAVFVLTRRRIHDRWTAMGLLAVYALFYVVLLSA